MDPLRRQLLRQCVGYRPDRLVDGLPADVHLLRLSYGNEPPSINESDVRSVEDAARKILSHKKSNWVYEREWRLVGTEGRLEITSKGCVRQLYLGSRIHDAYKDAIIAELTGVRVTVFAMEVDGYSHRWTKVKGLKV